MSIIKDEKRKTWSVSLRYQDQNGNNKRKYKRGFKNKKEAQSYKYEFLIKARKEKKLNMSMDAFFKIYLRDKKHKVKASTYRNIKSIYKNSIQKTFGKKEMEKITSRDILKWQNELSKQNYKPTTLRSYNNTLSAIFNHAYRYYELSDNPNKKVVAMGQEDSEAMKFWTLEEFNQFIACVENKEEKLYFNILFYTGIRLGEFLALRLKDIESNVEQTRFNFSLDNPNKFNSIGVRQIIFNDDLFKIDSPDSVSEFTSENLNENYSSHMLFLNNQNQVVSMLGDIDKTQIKNPLLIEKILRQAILSNSARMLFINEKADKQLPDINDFIPLMETSALFEVPLLDIVSLSTYGMESLRQNDPYTFEDILNIQEENNEYKLESREPEMKDKTIQMNLFDYFMDSEEFTIKQATELVKDQRNINVNNESIRARIYEGVDSGLFTRVSRGVYKVESQLQDKTVSCLLINGNGRDLSSIADESIDSIITDHPYDLTKSLTGGNRKFATYELFKYQEQDFKEKNRVLKEGAFCVEFLPEENEVNFEYLYNLKQMAIQQGFKYFAKVPWTKGDFVANTGRKSKNAEDVMIFSKGEPRALKLNAKKNYAEARENGLDITGLSSEQVKDLLQQNNLVVHYMKGTSGMLPKSFDYQPRSRKDKVMEAEKPVELLEDIIEYVTLPFEVVLDQFAGSGNLAIASANKNRSSILIEKDETMFNKMKENIEENIFTDEALNVIIEDLELIGLSDVIATHKISLGKLEELSKTNPVLKKELTTAKSLDKLDHKGLVKIPENNNQSIENNKIKR